MIIREYVPNDEQGWLSCRVVSFLNCSYFNDVKTKKEIYPHPAVCLVAEENGKIIGLIDIEMDSDDLTYNDRGRGAILWHMAVLPEYRRRSIATDLWEEAQKRLLSRGIRYCELWTQEDKAANRFYRSIGFEMENENTYIRCYARWDKCYELLDKTKTGDIYGAEELVFQAALQRKDELKTICYRIDEVRLYTKSLV